MFHHSYYFSKLSLMQIFLCFLQPCDYHFHQIIIVSFLVLVIAHKLKIVGEEVVVVGKVFEIILQ